MSVPSELGKGPIEDKYKGQSTADLLADDTFIEPKEPVTKEKPVKEEKIDDEGVEPNPEEDLLADEKLEKPKKEEKEDDEDEELEEKEEEPEAKADEPIFPAPRKVILAKYPNLFKDFPFLERATQRDRQFTEIFATPEDAREALSGIERLNNLNEAIFSGETSEVLKELKSQDQEAFNRVVDNYLPALGKADPNAYYHIMSNVSKALIADLYSKGKELQNEEVQAAAVILHKHLFGPNQWTPPQNLSKPVEKVADDKLSQREQEFVNRQYNGALNEVASKVDKMLTSTIDINIDPGGQLSTYEKQQVTKEVLKDIYNQMNEDTYFRGYYDKLWQKAAKDGFPPEQMDVIRKNYLARAKTLLKDTMARHRGQVLKDKKERPDKDRKGPIPAGRSGNAGNKQISAGKTASEKAKEIPKGMSTLDYLNSD